MRSVTELEQVRQEEAFDDGLHHGAHIACQFGAPFVILACGIGADWDERRDDTAGRSECPMCWNVDACPVCGVKLVAP